MITRMGYVDYFLIGEALKAQAVAARSYALYQAGAGKHGEAQICTDPGCCQAWLSEEVGGT